MEHTNDSRTNISLQLLTPLKREHYTQPRLVELLYASIDMQINPKILNLNEEVDEKGKKSCLLVFLASMHAAVNYSMT